MPLFSLHRPLFLSGPSHWREILIDAAAAAFTPVVLFLVAVNDVVFRNVFELRYHPGLVQAFFLAGGVVWIAGFLLIRRFRGRTAARVWLAIPLAVLLFDAVSGALDRWDAATGVAATADAAVFIAVVASALMMPWDLIQRAAALAGIVLLVQGSVAHALFVRDLPPTLIAGASRTERDIPAAPALNATGNVYHILLDNYLSETFKYSAGAEAPRRYPGFTFYSRFNTNFPHTSSSEMALLEGRFPKPGMSIEDWPNRALREGFWADLAVAKAGLWLYPYGRFLCPAYAVKCVSSGEIERDTPAATTRNATIDLWTLRLLPRSLRQALLQSADPEGAAARQERSWFSVTRTLGSVLEQSSDGTNTVSALPKQDLNLKQFDELLADEARRPAHGQYVYYHAMIPHPEFMMNERCEPVKPAGDAQTYIGFVRCANLMIERLVQTLARLGRLDDALIIVHADHGDPEFLVFPGYIDGRYDFALDRTARQYQAVDTTYSDDAETYESLYEGDSAAWRSIAVEVLSSGLLLTKFPHARTYSEDTRPVQIVDIAPTILAHFGRDIRSYPGTRIPLVKPGRESVFYAHSRDFDGKLSKYRLTGQGWQFVEDVPVRP